MKKTLLIAAGIMTHSLLFAQTTTKSWNSAPDQVKKLRQHSAAAVTTENGANKPTGTRQRLVGLAGYDKNGAGYAPTDSVTFGYTGWHNFRLTADNQLSNISPYDPTLDYNNFDTNTYYSVNPLMVTSKSIQQYNSADKLTLALNKEDNGSSLADKEKSEYTYNSQNQVTMIKGYEWDLNTNQWKNISIDHFYYNTAGKLVLDTLQMDGGSGLVPYHITSRTYNSAGNIAQELTKEWMGSSWENSYKYDYTYNTNNKILLNVAQQWTNNNWINQAKDSFAYNTNSVKIAEATYFDMGTGWMISYLETRHINGTSLPDTIKYYSTQGSSTTLVLDETDVFTYNSYNNIDKTVIDPGTPTESRFFFYYQLYNDLSVKNNENNENLNLYPNPVHEMLTVTLSTTTQQNTTVLVYSGLGQLQIKTAIAAGTKNIEIPVGNLAPGAYFIKCISADGAAAYQKMFIKN